MNIAACQQHSFPTEKVRGSADWRAHSTSAAVGSNSGHSEPRTKAANTERFVELPFLGKVAVRAKSEMLVVPQLEGRKVTVPVQSFSTPEGVLVRIEFRAHGPEPYQWPLNAVQEAMSSYGDKTVGLMTKPLPKSVESLLLIFATEVDLSKAKKWNLTFVMMSNILDDPATPVAILNVWGAKKGWPDLPDVSESLRIRCSYDFGRGVITIDDAL